MDREKKTVEVMIRMYCAKHHPSSPRPGGAAPPACRQGRDFTTKFAGLHSRDKTLCADCAALLDYARMRVQKCPFKQDKPTCAACTVHCYTPSMRAKIVAVMRYSGPRMLLKHPLLAMAHLKNGRKRNLVRVKKPVSLLG